jgi:hypothetical protein
MFVMLKSVTDGGGLMHIRMVRAGFRLLLWCCME